MNESKSYLRSLNINGFQWAAFKDGIYSFQKKSTAGYQLIECEPAQIRNGDLEFMVEHGLSLDENRKVKARKKYLSSLKN